MSNLEGYDPNSTWMSECTHDNSIDFFFTQRKVVEYNEKVDENLNRKKVKKNVTINFLALTFPNNQFQNKSNLKIEIEIWGDIKYHYTGTLINKEGEFPHLLLQLDTFRRFAHSGCSSGLFRTVPNPGTLFWNVLNRPQVLFLAT